ncbi:MAG: SBBP repeat-containing protein, partial [Flavobacteriales bacterium]|nr:SBBP repeat-containing protein [Flavobacteriales bacterium]
MKTLTLLTILSLATFAQAATPPVLPAAIVNSSPAPVGFEENKGQVRTTEGEAAPFVRYRLSQGNTQLFLLGNGIAYQFSRLHYAQNTPEVVAERQHDRVETTQMGPRREQVRLETFRMDMVLEGADANARITTEGRSEDYTQYYNHDALDVHTYTKVTYHEIYPGIDWVVYTTEKGMKYDFVVAPGVDPNQIRMRFQHYEELSVDAAGNLIHGNRMGRFTEERPVSFQDGKEVPTSFVLEGNTLRFALGNYDRESTLIIDPARIWGTYYGGDTEDLGLSCAVDGSGNVYLSGSTGSSGSIAMGGHQNSLVGSTDAYLAKFNSSGVRLWATYYGGDGVEHGHSCKTDGSGNVYLAGSTTSTNGIASGGHQNTSGGGVSIPYDAYLVKFSSAGVRQWGTYYGGSGDDEGRSCAVDGSGNVYLAGYSLGSLTGIASGGHQNAHAGNNDAFLVKFNSAGVRQWGTYYGGAEDETRSSCATDGSGNVYMAGITLSSSGIASGGHLNTPAGQIDCYLVKFNSAGQRQWGTYYGGLYDESAGNCAVDGSGNVYLSGSTSSYSGITTTGSHQDYHGGEIPAYQEGTSTDAFLAKFNTSGVRLWSTYYGGWDPEAGQACTTDGNNNVYLTGETQSPINISSGGHQDTYAGSWDAFLVLFNESGVRQWGTYYGAGGEFDDWARSCATDGNNDVYMAGQTGSPTAIASGGHQNTHGGAAWDGFLAKFEGDDTIDLDCATATMAETEPNNSVSTSNPLTYGTPISGDMGDCTTIDNTSDYFSFTTTGQGVLRVEACLSNTGPSALDVTFRVLNPGGSTLGTFTLPAGANNAVLTGEFLLPCRGTTSYRIAVDNPSTTVCTHYAFSYTILPPLFGNDPEPNDAIGASATPVTYNTDRDGRNNFDGETTYDYYSITLPTNGVLNIETQAEHAGAVPSTMAVALLNSVGTVQQTWNVAVGANGTPASSAVSIPCRSTVNTYYIRINSAICGTSYRFKYTVTAPLFAADVEPNNSQPGTPLAHNTYTEGHLAFDSESTYDYYRIVPSSDGKVNIEVQAEHTGATAGTIQLVFLNTAGTALQTWNIPLGTNGVASTTLVSLPCQSGGTNYDLRLSTATCGTSYKMKYTLTPALFANDAEPNNSTATAVVAADSTNNDGHLAFAESSADYFRLQAGTDGVLNVTVSAEHAIASTTDSIQVRLFDYITNTLVTWKVGIGANGIPNTQSFARTCAGTEQVYFLAFLNPSVCGVSYRFSYTVTPPAFADDLEPNQSSGQATIANANTNYDGRVEFDYDNNTDYFQLQAPTDGEMSVTIEAENAGPGTGTMTLYLRDFITNIIETWTVNVGANGVPISNTFTHRCTGTEQVYYLQHENPSVCGVSYRFSYAVTPPVFADDLEPNQSSGAAIIANANTNYDGRVDFNYDNDYDYFRLQAPNDGALNVTIEAENAGPGTGTMTLYLRDAITNVIETWTVNIGANGTSVPQTFSHTCTGTQLVYFLEPYHPTVCGVSYRFSYTVTPPLFAGDSEPNNNTATAVVAADSTNYDGLLAFNESSADYFRLQAGTDGVLNVTVSAEHATANTTDSIQVRLLDYITNTLVT